MALPSPPQNEPQDSKDAKKSIMRDSLISIVKQGYENRNNPKKKNPKRESLINSTVVDPDTAFQIWKYPG